MKKAILSFQFVDLKLDKNNHLKVLEFGRGMDGWFQGYDCLYPKTMMTHFWEHLKSFNLPIWFIPYHRALSEVGKDRYIQLAGLKEAIQNPLFQIRGCDFLEALEDKSWGVKKENFDPSDLSTYSGIIIYHDQMYRGKELLEALKKYPHILVLDGDGAIDEILHDKFLSNQLFKKSLANFKPKWNIYFKNQSRQIYKKVCQDVPNSDVIIKPLLACRGRGVIPVNQHELEKTLTDALPNYFSSPQFIKDGDENNDEIWQLEKSPIFLIEEFINGKTVLRNKSQYEGVVRVVYIAEQNLDKIKIKFLGSYWKLPPKSLEEGRSIHSLVTKIDPNGPYKDQSSSTVSPEDSMIIQGQLQKILPSLFKKMIDGDTKKVVNELLSSHKKEHIAYGIFVVASLPRIDRLLLKKLKALAKIHDPDYDHSFSLLFQDDWRAHPAKHKELIPILHDLARSPIQDVRENVIIACLKYHNRYPELKEILFQMKGDGEKISNLKARCVYFSFLFNHLELSLSKLLFNYKAIFNQEERDSQEFIVQDLFEKGIVDKAPWATLPQFKPKRTSIVKATTERDPDFLAQQILNEELYPKNRRKAWKLKNKTSVAFKELATK